MRGISRAAVTGAAVAAVALAAGGYGLTLASARPAASISAAGAGAGPAGPTARGAALRLDAARRLAGPGATGGTGWSGTPGAGGGAGAAAPYPISCCVSGYPLGVTTTGQATVHGSGSRARMSAVTRAFSDARSQAAAVAGFGGVKLGPVIDVQVSAPYPFYPVPLGAAGTGGPAAPPTAPAVQGGAPGQRGTATACVSVPGCTFPVSITATVTVTWAIAR